MAVLMSFKPYWYYLIGEKIKTDEVRKTIAKFLWRDTTVECYMAKDKKSFARIPKEFQDKYKTHFGKVGMRFTCESIDEYHTEFYAEDDVYQEIRRVFLDGDFEEDYEIIADNDSLADNELLKSTCLTLDELKRYAGYGWSKIFTWHISDVKIYDKPKELGEFRAICKLSERKCKMCSNCYDKEDYYGRHYAVHSIERPPQSWCYVD